MTIGLKDLYMAKITMIPDPDDPELEIEEMGTPERLAKAISVGLKTTFATGELYADDSLEVQLKEFVSGELTLGVDDLAPEKTSYLLGQKTDDNGILFAGGTDEPPFVAIGFRARKPGGTYRYVWLLKVKFSVPDETLTTKGSGITFNTPSIVGTFQKRNKDDNWKADYTGKPTDTAAADWFKNVPDYVEPTVTTPPAE